MSIDLHCPNCNKHIRAPDNAGGKSGTCPACKQSVYIPLPVDQNDVIGLAEVDDGEERRAEQLREESIGYAANVDHERSAAALEPKEGSGSADQMASGSAPGEVVDLGGDVKQYVLAMRDSKLEEAERIAADLDRAGARAQDYVQGLMLDQMPPQFEDVPQPLVQGFLKALLGRLKSGQQ